MEDVDIVNFMSVRVLSLEFTENNFVPCQETKRAFDINCCFVCFMVFIYWLLF